MLKKGVGEPADSAAGFRDVSLGYDKVAALIGSSKPNVKGLLEALQRKLAIEVVGEENSRIRQCRTYRVFSQADILRRRRSRLWVVPGRGPGVVGRGSDFSKKVPGPNTKAEIPAAAC